MCFDVAANVIVNGSASSPTVQSRPASLTSMSRRERFANAWKTPSISNCRSTMWLRLSFGPRSVNHMVDLHDRQNGTMTFLLARVPVPL